jgi:hypothetical protein
MDATSTPGNSATSRHRVRRRTNRASTAPTAGKFAKRLQAVFESPGRSPTKTRSASHPTIPRSGLLSLKATSGSISGDYIVQDAEWAAAVIINTTLRIDRRTLLPTSSRRTPIPQHVRNEVWQRDHGRCVQCHANDYLEFDHIIPKSKGGADTVGNIQLLCRRCNLQKSDRI